MQTQKGGVRGGAAFLFRISGVRFRNPPSCPPKFLRRWKRKTYISSSQNRPAQPPG